MPVLIVSNPADGTSQRVEIDDQQLRALYGTRIGQVVEGAVADMQGYRIRLTGGTDKDGIPMRPDVHGSAKARVVLSGGVGYKPKDKGEKKRKVVRGNTVNAEIAFLNFTVVEAPKGKKKTKKEQEPAEAPEAEEAE
jgi:small subunit ribosomal protein S6e